MKNFTFLGLSKRLGIVKDKVTKKDDSYSIAFPFMLASTSVVI